MKRRKDFEAEYRSLMRMVPQPFHSLTFTEYAVKATTQEINVEYDGCEYELGQYVITISFQESDIRIENLVESGRDYDHPHVSNGVPCLGNLTVGVSKLLAEVDYAGLLQVLVQFLESYNDGNPYLKIEHWDPNYRDGDEQERIFENCWESVSNFDCVDCSDDACPYHDDAEYRCWENSSIRECIACRIDRCRYQEQALVQCRSDHQPCECVECEHDSCPYAGMEQECRDSHNSELCRGCEVADCKFYVVDDPAKELIVEANQEGVCDENRSAGS